MNLPKDITVFCKYILNNHIFSQIYVMTIRWGATNIVIKTLHLLLIADVFLFFNNDVFNFWTPISWKSGKGHHLVKLLRQFTTRLLQGALDSLYGHLIVWLCAFSYISLFWTYLHVSECSGMFHNKGFISIQSIGTVSKKELYFSKLWNNL